MKHNMKRNIINMETCESVFTSRQPCRLYQDETSGRNIMKRKTVKLDTRDSFLTSGQPCRLVSYLML